MIKPKKEFIRNLILLFLSCISCLLVLELTIRFLIYPSEKSYGTFLGHELPPVKLIPYTSPPPHTDRDQRYGDLVVEGKKISIGDLWGFFREDPILGYAPKENTISLNGWWQSNSIGARATRETRKNKAQGKRRILVFGDSFANGSRVRQEETWASIMDAGTGTAEVINFGVDGYSMAQSYLRYRLIKKQIDYDVVLLMFAPSADLWRDINTFRDLGEEGWDVYIVMPRFVVDQGKLKLIKSPYGVGSSIYSKNGNSISEELKTHLRLYDRFYFAVMFEESWLIRNSAVYKLFGRTYYDLKRRWLRNKLLEAHAEAVQVSREIFRAMNNEVKLHGKEFMVVILPTERDLRKLRKESGYRATWNEMVSAICINELLCVDLSEDLGQIPVGQLDKGYDGSHYGPKTNRGIAELIKKHFDNLGLL